MYHLIGNISSCKWLFEIFFFTFTISIVYKDPGKSVQHNEAGGSNSDYLKPNQPKSIISSCKCQLYDINDIYTKKRHFSALRKTSFWFNSDWHLASEKLFSSVAVDMGAEEDAPSEGFATVGANMW